MMNLQRTLALGWLVAAATIMSCGTSKLAQQVSQITCHADGDCPSPTICQVCNEKCVFKPNAECSLDAPCPCGYSCRNAVCAINAGGTAATCTYNSDCPVDEFCNRAQFQCEYPMVLGSSTGVSCTANAQCADGDVCSTAGGGAAGECAPNETVECHTSTECPSNENCNGEGQCEHITC